VFGAAALDPASLGAAVGEAGLALVRRPRRLFTELAGLAFAEAGVAVDVGRALLGIREEPIAAPDGDRRFADRAWTENPAFRAAMESYLVAARWSRRVLADTALPAHTRLKAEFALDVLLDALAPANFPWLNPAVLKEAFDTGGLSSVQGLRNFADDLVHRGGRPRQVDTEPFVLGETLAATPGRIVLRNDLIELIGYEPQTETVYERPLVYSPAWINKYYVLDLAPGRSFLEHAVRAGHTVFAISYRNPDASMSEVRLDDYLRDGVLAAIGRAAEITGSPTVDLVSVCMGGTLAAATLGVLAGRGESPRIGTATFLNALVDFADPGQIGAFVDDKVIERIEARNARRGYLSETDMTDVFTLMRGNDLLWNYVVSNWLMGRQPPAFDVLAWNDDSTRLPAAMHSQYLRACYLDNALTRPGALVLDGTPIDLSAVETPVYVLGSEKDHIAPWRSAYATTRHLGGPARFVLASGGHIVGLVQPPGGRNPRFRASEITPDDPDAWLAGSEEAAGSWWDDWAAWAGARAGDRVAPPTMPAGPPAPGEYVRS
jgi:polyhydroxyalkanoate synthase